MYWCCQKLELDRNGIGFLKFLSLFTLVVQFLLLVSGVLVVVFSLAPVVVFEL